MTASLLPISSITVPAQQGTTVALNGSGTTDAQTFTVKSSNPDIGASVGSDPFWTINVSYTDPTNAANDFSGPLTFDLFQSLTPVTVGEIQTFTNDGYYTDKTFTRIVSNFSGAGSGDYVLQGGAPTATGAGSSGQPGTPYINEPVQALAYTGQDQLGIANAGPNTNDTQFFVTTGSPNTLSYAYTLFGQLVSGQSTLASMTQVPVETNPSSGEDSYPVNPVVMSSVSLSSTNPNGALVIDTTNAKAGETSTITVTATDSVDHSSTVQTFTVTVGAYGGVALATPVSAHTTVTKPVTVSLNAQITNSSYSSFSSVGYTLLTQPAHGTISSFNATTGTFVYTPKAGFVGTDTFEYQAPVLETGSGTTIAASNPTTVSIVTNPVTDDFTGVGITDLAVVRPASDTWLIRTPTGGTTVTQIGDTTAGDIPVPGDYEGIGKSDQAVFRPSTDQWIIRLSTGATKIIQFGDASKGDVPVPGDYEGNGITDLAVFRPSTDQWIIRLSTGATRIVQFGDPTAGDIPVPGDYDGDGITDFAVFRPSTDQWIIRDSSTNALVISQMGDVSQHDIPVPGDYNGSGKTDLAVYRPSTSQWIVRYPTGTTQVYQFGDPTHSDLPLNAPLDSLGLLQPLAAHSLAASQPASASSLSSPALALAPMPSFDLSAFFNRPGTQRKG